MIHTLIDDYISMTEAGRILDQCRKYYADQVEMLSNGNLFASSQDEAYLKQQLFLKEIDEMNIKLLSRSIDGLTSKLVFTYAVTFASGKSEKFTGTHDQEWNQGKIIRENFTSTA